ncbi:MAG: hypothetical protein AB9842_14030 [Bacteroidales bacterium]
MIRKYKNITALLLALILAVPWVVKAGHHHDKSHHCEKNDNCAIEESCAICDFNYSFFTSEFSFYQVKTEILLAVFNESITERIIPDSQYFSIFLRAPPRE